MVDELFGGKGIDTPYEHKQMEYHPELSYPQHKKGLQLDPQIIRNIERAKDFTISQSLFDYDNLIQNIQELMNTIETRNRTEDFKLFKDALNTKKKVVDIENKLCGYDGSGDAEIYHILYKMLNSCTRRREFLDKKFRTQFTNKTDAEQIQQAENDSIDEWHQMQNQFIDLQNQLATYQPSDEEEGSSEADIYMQEAANQELAVNNKASLHNTLADTGYIHRNRTTMFNQILGQLQILVNSPQMLMPSDLKDCIMTMATGDLTAIKAHLILTFNQTKKDQNALKGAYIMMDDDKEDFISNQQWFHQQLETSVNNPLKNWLYNQSDTNHAFNDLADLLVGSLEHTQKTYKNSNNDLLKFYQQESTYYANQIAFIQKKEQIRQFLRIIEDIGDVRSLTVEWITNYLQAHGYSTV